MQKVDFSSDGQSYVRESLLAGTGVAIAELLFAWSDNDSENINWFISVDSLEHVVNVCTGREYLVVEMFSSFVDRILDILCTSECLVRFDGKFIIFHRLELDLYVQFTSNFVLSYS